MFKKKPIKIKAYTTDRALLNYFKPEKANRNYPKWFKKLLANDLDNMPTMTGCAGFLDMYAKAIAVPLWTDLNVEVGKIGEDYSEAATYNPLSKLSKHPHEQRGEWLPEKEYQHIKANSPWLFSCDEDVDFFLVGNPFINDIPHRMQIVPGVVSLKYQNEFNLNIIFKREPERYQAKLKYGEPYGFLIPLTERNFEIEYSHITEQEFQDILQGEKFSYSKFNYLRERKMRKKAYEKKCPFGFGGKK